NKHRITLPEILIAVERQTDGKVKVYDFAPSCCDDPRGGFHGDFVVLPKNNLLRLTAKSNKSSCCDGTAHLKNRNFVARRWKRSADDDNINTGAPSSSSDDYTDMGAFLKRVKSHGFTITAMAFQDAYTLDMERLRMCSLHVYNDDRIMPFCANYITPYDRIV
ncbi:MAG: radical SAM protein, partial [Clostridiales bacterium]|nr:radical SAM protein [Clostridiales bacterium]